MLHTEPWSTIPFSHCLIPLYAGCKSSLVSTFSQFCPLTASGPCKRSSEGDKDAPAASAGAASACLPEDPPSLQPEGSCPQVVVFTRKQGKPLKWPQAAAATEDASTFPNSRKLVGLDLNCSLRETFSDQREEEKTQWFGKE